ncbi:hypothetical protein B0H11DRAFT_191936 [Mycena galericulata]|nr:hypothetical protein B0H11DRAFT_191936 [Mycena galericulata]
MIFSTSLLVAALGLFASASPVPSRDAELAARDTVPNTSVVPLSIFAVFQTLEEAVTALTPGLDAIPAAEGAEGQTGSVAPLLDQLVAALDTATSSLATLSPGDMGAADQDLATLIENVLDDLNTALNKLVPKLGLNGLLTPVDGALSGLLTGLNGLLPGLLATVGAILIPVGGVVGGLLSSLGLGSL